MHDLRYLLPYGWDWKLAMAFGSILAATDPVAVVALLKAVGASPKLTMQITGEALMNDGTAILLFMLFMDFYNGVLRDPWQIATFFIQARRSFVRLRARADPGADWFSRRAPTQRAALILVVGPVYSRWCPRHASAQRAPHRAFLVVLTVRRDQ